jgi:hypothetical protein
MSTPHKSLGYMTGIVMGLLLVTVMAAQAQYASAQINETSNGSLWNNSHCVKDTYQWVCAKDLGLKVTSPTKHQNISGTVTVTGLATGSGIIKIQLKTDHGHYNTIPNINGAFNAFIAGLSPGTHTIHVKATDSAYYLKIVSITFKIV